LEYAGHGMRHRESFYRDFDELADDMYQQIKKEKVCDDYALMGYSMGSIAVVEILKRINQENALSEPQHIFLAAHEPHTKRELENFDRDFTDEDVKKRTLMFGGVHPSLVDNERFWQMYLPVFKADYRLIGGYQFEGLDMKCNIPATVFYSPTDTPKSSMLEWSRFFVGKCDYIAYKGNHFFMEENCSDMAEKIVRGMT
jgi:surfactin synthase thioesterase subunit